MAIDGANLHGAFPVYDTSKSVGTYTATLQKQAAQRAAEQKALQDDLGKIKIDGLRDADKTDYFNGFEEWRNTAQAATKERDFRKKAELQSQADKAYLNLQSLVNKSKEYGRMHQDVSGKFLDDRFRDQFTDDAVEKWRTSGKLPLSSKDIVIDPTALGRQMDLSGVQKAITDIDEDLLKQAKYSNPITRPVKNGSKTGIESTYTRTVDPVQQAERYEMLYNTKRDIKNYFRQEYADVYDKLGEEEAKKFAINDFVSKNPIQRQDAPKLDWDREPDNFYAHYDYQLANPKDGSNATASTPKTLTLPFGRDDTDNTTVRNAVFIPSANKNFVGSDAIDLKSGKPIKLTESSNDYEMVALVEVPFMKDGKITTRDSKGGVSEASTKGAIAQTKFANDKNNRDKVEYKPMIQVQFKHPTSQVKRNYLVPIDRLPENLTKKDQALADQFKKNIGYNKQQSSPAKNPTQKSSKTVPAAKIKSMVGKKGFEGYSEKELIEYYKSQGYTIK